MATNYQRSNIVLAMQDLGWTQRLSDGSFEYAPSTRRNVMGGSMTRGDRAGGAQLRNLWQANEVLSRRLTRGQQSSLTKIKKDITGRGAGDPDGQWGGSYHRYGMNWALYGQNEAMKVLLRGGNRKQAMAVASRIYDMSHSFDAGLPPTASKRYIIRSNRATDEERYERSNGRGSNARSMNGLGLRNATAPASGNGGGGGSIARTTPRSASLEVSRRSGSVGMSGS